MAGLMLVSTAIVFVVVYVNTGTQVERQIESDVASDTGQLTQVLAALRNPTAGLIASRAASYVDSQPYDPSSPLYFVLLPGRPIISNQPELFTRRGQHGTRPQRASETSQLDALRRPHLGYATSRLAGVGQVRTFERPLRLGSVHAVVGAGESLKGVDRAQDGVARAFVLAGALSIVLALLVSYLAGARLAAPLRGMAAVAARVDAGDLQPRMSSSPEMGEEMRILADAFNRMLDRLSEAFAGQREFVADASHELRTPLTVIRGQLELLAATADPSREELARVEGLVLAEVTRVTRLVDDLLLLAQAEHRDFLRPEPIELDTFVADLWDGLSLTADRRFELGPPPSGTLQADPDRLAQALRNLGRNAVEHTTEGSGIVRLDVEPLPDGRVLFTVLDNGPGIPAAEREAVFERFHRVGSDFSRARSRQHGGAGLGLAIVRAIAEAHGGRVRATAPVTGTGARIELELPGYS
jgi:signal transduction histidine kinase